jgi:tRNA pseudouridine55 synthase
MIDGLAVVDKPPGMTSHDVVGRCRRIFGQKKVGHAGTLDPDATGVLVVGLGRATRLLQFMSGLSKTYQAEIVLGVSTTTLDASGQVTGTFDMSQVTLEDIRRCCAALTGTIEKIPPMVSALKVGGKRLHQLARAGIEVERAAREVIVDRFSVTEIWPGDEGRDPSSPVVAVEIDCSSGTYVRVLAADLGRALGGGAHVGRLRRTAVGPWRIEGAIPLVDLGPQHVRPPVEALPWLTPVVVTDEIAREVAVGKILPESLLGAAGTGPWTVVGPSGELLAVYAAYGVDRAKPAVVLAGATL